MHGINVENKGFKTLTDYVRVRYVPSASSKAYVGQKVKGVYWNGVKGAHPAANIMVNSSKEGGSVWVQCSETGLYFIYKGLPYEYVTRTSEGVHYLPEEVAPWKIGIVEFVVGTWSHTLFF